MFRLCLPRIRRRTSPATPPAVSPHALHYPLEPSPRVAILGLPLAAGPGQRRLTEWTVVQLESARPQALAAPLRDLEEVASLRALGILKLKSLAYPLIVFTSEASGRLSDADHDRLWRWFRLPVFEQVRASDGRLLAWESEDRNGFHLADDAPATLYDLDLCAEIALASPASVPALTRPSLR